MTGGVRAHPLLGAAAGAVIAVGGAYGIAVGAPATIPYLAFLILLFVLVERADRHVHFSTGVLVGLTIWAAMHLAGGLVPVGDGVLYNVWLLPVLRVDHVVHAFGFGFAALAAWEVVERHTLPTVGGRIGVGVTVALLGMGAGAVNEVIEFVSTRVLPSTNVGGYVNTGLDLVANLAGSVLAAIWVVRRRRCAQTSDR